MPAGRLQISTSSTHDGGPIQAIGYINDTLKLAQDNDRVGGKQHPTDLDVVAKNGVNSSHAARHSFGIAGYGLPHFSSSSSNAAHAASTLGAV